MIDLKKLRNRENIKAIRETDSVITEQGRIKKYISKVKRLTIQNANKLIDIKLLSSYRKMVCAGESVLIAEMKLKEWKEKHNLFDKLSFYDIKRKYRAANKEFTLKWCEEKTIQMSLPTDISEKLRNNKIFEKQIGDWENAIEFTTLDELPHKDIRIGIFVKTVLKEKIEWLPTIEGVDIYEWAAYDVTVIDSLDHRTDVCCWFNSLALIDSTHFMLAYCDTTADIGYLQTFSIDSLADNITKIASVEYDATNGEFPSLIKIDATHFILAFGGTADRDGYLKTFSIDASYENITEIASLEHDTSWGLYNSLVKIDATHFILAYYGGTGVGHLKTFSIDASYENITEIDDLTLDTSGGAYNSLVKIDATHFILAYYGNDGDGFIKTFSIDGSYDNITEIDSLEHDTSSALFSSLVILNSTHFALVYLTSSSHYGYIKTFSIDGSYDNITQIDSLQYSTDAGSCCLVNIDSTHVILEFANYSDYTGIVKVFSIDSNYDITEKSSMEHNPKVFAQSMSFIHIDSNHFIFAFGNGDNGSAIVETFVMEEIDVHSPLPAFFRQ